MRKIAGIGYVAVIAACILVANTAAQEHWPLWTITIAGAIFLGAVVAYVMAAQRS